MANLYSIILKGKISPESIKKEIEKIRNSHVLQLNAEISQSSISQMKQQIESALSNIKVGVTPIVNSKGTPITNVVGGGYAGNVSTTGGEGYPTAEGQRILNAQLAETVSLYNEQGKPLKETKKYLDGQKNTLTEIFTLNKKTKELELKKTKESVGTGLKQEKALIESNTKKYNDLKLTLQGLYDAGKLSASSFQTLNMQLDKFQNKMGDSGSKVGFSLFGQDVNLAKQNMTMYSNIGERIKRLGSDGIVSQTRIRELNKELSRVSSMANEVDKAKGFEQLNQQISDSKKQTMSFGQMLSTAYKKFAIWSIATVTWYSMVRMIRNVVKEVISLDKAFTSLQIVTKNTTEQMERLKAEYIQMADELGATLTTVAEGSDSWLRAGLTAGETNRALTASTMLSVIANEQAATSTDHLIAIMKAYKLEATQLIGVVDKLSEVDVVSASSSEDIGEALTLSANSARLAGVELDKYIGIIATVKEVTQQSASTIGNSFKTMFARMTAVKLGSLVDENGEDISDVMTVLKQYNIELLDEVTGDFKNMGVVLDEIGAKWGSLNKAQRSEIATTIAGLRQREKFLALMENYERALELEQVSLNSAGAAMEKYNIYTDSVEASLNRIKVAFSEMSMATLKSKDVKNVSEFVVGLMKGVTATGGLVKSMTLLLGVMMTIKNIDFIVSLKRNIDGVKGFINVIQQLAGAGKLLSTATGFIGLALTAISAIFMLVSAQQNKIKQIKENIINLSEENLVSLDELKRRYTELYEMQDKTAEQQKEMISLQERISKSFEKTTGKVMETTSAYKDNINAIEEMGRAEINKILSTSKPEYDKALKKLEKTYRSSLIDNPMFNTNSPSLDSEEWKSSLLREFVQISNTAKMNLSSGAIIFKGNYKDVKADFDKWFELYGNSLGAISEYDEKINTKMSELYSTFINHFGDSAQIVEDYNYYLDLLDSSKNKTKIISLDSYDELDKLLNYSKNLATSYGKELDNYVKGLENQNEELQRSISLSEKYLAIRQAMLSVEKAQADVMKARQNLDMGQSYDPTLISKDAYSTAKSSLGSDVLNRLSQARDAYVTATGLMSQGKITKEELADAYSNYEKIRNSIGNSYDIMQDYLSALQLQSDELAKQNEELSLKEQYNKSILDIAEKQYDVNNAMSKLEDIDQFYNVSQAKQTYEIGKIAKEYPLDELTHYIEALEYQNDKIREQNDLLEKQKAINEAIASVQEASADLQKAYLKLQNESEFYNVDKARQRYDIAKNLYELPIDDLSHLIESLEYQNSVIDRQNELNQKELDIQEKLLAIEKAREELAKAKQSRIRIYREGQGFVYEEDVFAVAEANASLMDANKDLKESQDALKEFYEDRELQSLKDYLELLKGVKGSQEAVTKSEEALSDAQKKLNEFYQERELNKLKQYSQLIKDLKSAQESLTDAEKSAAEAKGNLEKFYEESKREKMKLYADNLKALMDAEDNLTTATINLVNANKEFDKLNYDVYLTKVKSFVDSYKSYLAGDTSVSDWVKSQGSYGLLLNTEFESYLSKAKKFINDYHAIMNGITIQPDVQGLYDDELWEALLDAQTTSGSASVVMNEWANYNSWLAKGGLASGSAYKSLYETQGVSSSSGTKIEIGNLNLPNVQNAHQFVQDIIDMFNISVQQTSSSR